MKTKKAFVLVTTLILVVTISYISLQIVTTSIFGANLTKLKYLNLQATIYFDKTKQYILSHTDEEIEAYETSWDNTKYTLSIDQDDTNSSIYYVVISTTDNTHIRVSNIITK